VIDSANTEDERGGRTDLKRKQTFSLKSLTHASGARFQMQTPI